MTQSRVRSAMLAFELVFASALPLEGCASTHYRNLSARAVQPSSQSTESAVVELQAALCFDLATERASRQATYETARDMFFVGSLVGWSIFGATFSDESWTDLRTASLSVAITTLVGGFAWWGLSGLVDDPESTAIAGAEVAAAKTAAIRSEAFRRCLTGAAPEASTVQEVMATERPCAEACKAKPTPEPKQAPQGAAAAAPQADAAEHTP